MIEYKKKSFVKIILAVLLIVLEIFFITLPSINQIYSKQSEIAEQLFIADRLLKKGQTVNRLHENIEQVQPFLERLDSVFFDPSEQLLFIVSLEELGNQKDVESVLKLSDIPNVKGIVEVPVSLSAKGSFKNILDYIIAIQQLPFYINIKSISIRSLRIEGDAELESTLMGTTYWAKSIQ